ncbi:MAG: cytochrome P450 [Deltaproteobacteria bacterium]|nr:cytochrome P450 [Deltaproteobacteria bacterium]
MPQDSPDAHIVDADYFEAHGYPHATWDEMRAKRPIHHIDRAQGDSFWALTRYDEIVDVSGRPLEFSSEIPAIRDEEQVNDEPSALPAVLIQLDPPIHTKYRQLVSRRMTPRKVAAFHHQIEEIAVGILDDLAQHEETGCDFVETVAAPLPIAVIAYLLGVPIDDWRKLYTWTNESAGASDPEFRREGESARETMERANVELFTYFAGLREKRIADPQDDLITLLANAEVDGEPLPLIDILAFYQILVAAGNETTRNATSGGLLAFIENPDEMRKVQADPSLVKPAVEEILRWTSPVIHFSRTATVDTEVAGQKISKGEVVGMFYPSANRDDAIFDDPRSFRVDRKRNPHIAFGVGEHYCVGAHVARLELQVIFRHLLPRLEEAVVAGPIDRLRSNLIGGVKRLPIEYKLRPA